MFSSVHYYLSNHCFIVSLEGALLQNCGINTFRWFFQTHCHRCIKTFCKRMGYSAGLGLGLGLAKLQSSKRPLVLTSALKPLMMWVFMAEQLHASLTSPRAMPSVWWTGVKHTATCLRSAVNVSCEVTDHTSLSGSLTDKVWAWRMPGKPYLPDCIWWRDNGTLFVFFSSNFGLDLQVWVKRNPNAIAWVRPFSVPALLRLNTQGKYHEDMTGKVWKNVAACMKPWPQPYRTPLGWTGTKNPSQAIQQQSLTSQMLLCMNLQKLPHTHFKLLWKTFPKELQRWHQLHINAYGFRMGC